MPIETAISSLLPLIILIVLSYLIFRKGYTPNLANRYFYPLMAIILFVSLINGIARESLNFFNTNMIYAVALLYGIFVSIYKTVLAFKKTTE